MIASPCRNCDNRHMPKKLCIRNCAKIAAMQKLQHTRHTPPYPFYEGSRTLPDGLESCMTPVREGGRR